MTDEQIMHALHDALRNQAEKTCDYVRPLTESFESGWPDLVIDGTFNMLKIAQDVRAALGI